MIACALMKCTSTVIYFAVIVVAIAGAQSGSNRLPTVRVATDATWPPMQFIDQSRAIVGFDIDLFDEIGSRAGFRPVYENVAWDGIFAGLVAGHYDVIVSSVTLLPERRRHMLFSDPYFVAEQYLVVRSDQATIGGITDLVGREVGAEIGTTGAEFVRRTHGVNLRTYDDLGLGLADLVNGRIAGVVADTAIIEFYVLQHPVYRDRLTVVGEPYAVEDYAIAIRRDRADLQLLINAALREIVADGTWERLYKRWFTVSAREIARPE